MSCEPVGGLGDYLAREPGIGIHDPAAHRLGKIELCTFTAPFKRELFPRLRRAFEPPVKLRIPIDTAIREDLHAMRQIIHAGQYSYAAPRTAEGHSDRCTALALALHAAGSARTAPAQIHLFPPAPGSRRAAKRDRSAMLA